MNLPGFLLQFRRRREENIAAATRTPILKTSYRFPCFDNEKENPPPDFYHHRQCEFNNYLLLTTRH
jgi:hypothetical protein